MGDSIKSRLQLLITELKNEDGKPMNPNSFSVRIGENAQSTHKYLKGDSKPGFDYINSVLSTFSDINADWLLTGRGEMFRSKTQNKGSLPIVVTVDNSGSDNIVLVDTKAAAGYRTHINDVEFIKQLPTFSLPSKVLRNGMFRAFIVRGDSMMPKNPSGSMVVGQYLDNWQRDVKDGRLYIVVTEDDIVLKRVVNRIEDRKHLLLKSDNPAYSAYKVEQEEVKEVWEWKCVIDFDGSNPFFDLLDWNQRLENSIIDLQDEILLLKGNGQRLG